MLWCELGAICQIYISTIRAGRVSVEAGFLACLDLWWDVDGVHRISAFVQKKILRLQQKDEALFRFRPWSFWWHLMAGSRRSSRENRRARGLYIPDTSSFLHGAATKTTMWFCRTLFSRMEHISSHFLKLAMIMAVSRNTKNLPVRTPC